VFQVYGVQDSHLHPTNAVEILGKVNEDLSVQLFTAVDFGSNIGMFSKTCVAGRRDK
jgi:hypothetical protein